jgi:hypothetical protein
VPGLIDRRRIYAEAQRVLDGIGFRIDLRLPVASRPEEPLFWN